MHLFRRKDIVGGDTAYEAPGNGSGLKHCAGPAKSTGRNASELDEASLESRKRRPTGSVGNSADCCGSMTTRNSSACRGDWGGM